MNNGNEMTTLSDKITEASARAMLHATNAAGKVLTKKWGKYLLVLPVVISLCTMTVCATSGGSSTNPNDFINEIIKLLKEWIPRLGGMVIVVGGIQLGLGFKDDNQDGKTRGMQCMIGGAIVAAIGTMVKF